MKTSKLIVIFMLVMCITLVSGSSVFANEGNAVNEPNKEQVISSNEDEKESLKQEEAHKEVKVREEESSNTTNNEIDNSKKESTPASKTNKLGSRAIVNSTWGTSPVTFDESTGILTVEAGELASQPHSLYLDNNNNTIKKEDVIKIMLGNGVKAPQNSAYLFSSDPDFRNHRFFNLTSIVGTLDTSNVIYMNLMFWDASSLVELDTSNWDTSRVITMRQMFVFASSLKELDVSSWNTSNVTDMAGMFQEARSMVELDTNSWNTSNVTNMDGMFNEARALEKLNVSNWNTRKVTGMSAMFRNARSLKELDVSNWDTSKISDMYHMFYFASSLKELNVSNWDIGEVKYMQGAFCGASSLKELDVSHWNTSKVEEMWATFAETLSLVNLDVSNWDTTNVTSMGYMFSYARSLTELDVSNWKTSKVTSMTYMFNGASSLTNLDVSNWDTSKVKWMDSMFNSVHNLKELDVSSWDTSQVINMQGMLADASSLKSLDVSSWDTSQAGYMNNMLSNVKLETFTLGDKSIFNASVNLPAIDTTSGEYTGRWERIDPVAPESIYDSSNVFMSNYDGAMTGTYVWQRTSYTIIYELNGGINDPSNPLSYAHGVGVESFEDATKVGYDFLGWVDASDNPVTNIPNTETGNKVLYATWQIAIPLPAEVYTITYELDGGTNDLSNPTYYSFGIGVDSFADATKDGYTFLGWKDANNNPIISISDTETGNKILYAKWEKNSDNPENPGNTDNGGTNKNKGNNNNPVDKGKPSTLPQTGDSSRVSAMILLLTGSLITGGYLITRRKKQ